MGDKGGVKYLVHFKHISIPVSQECNKPRLRDLILLPHLIPGGTITVKYYQGLLKQCVIHPQLH